VQAILAARIDCLTPEAKRPAPGCCLHRQGRSPAAVARHCRRAGAQVRAELTRLQGAEFLYEATLFPDLEYTFKHALTHEVAYQGLLQDRRRDLHPRITEAIERLAAERIVEQSERLPRLR
jgi:hypothetical protein